MSSRRVGLAAFFAGLAVAHAGCEFAPSGELVDGAPPDAARDAAPPIDALAVPAGYAPLDGTASYYRWGGQRLELGKAFDDCADDAPRATVVVIDDAAENEAVRQLAASYPDGREIWLGIQDWQDEDVWRTLAYEPVGFTAWRPGEPNDAGQDGEDCAVLLARYEPAHDEGRWNDIACGRTRAYVCEWRLP